jgi:hypothetical protein
MRISHMRYHGVWLGIGALIAAVVLPASAARAAGGAWSVVAAPNPAVQFTYLQSVDATSDSDGWAVGYVQPPTASPFQPVALHWNGTAWTSAAVPQLGNDGTILVGVSTSQASDAWAVGYAFNQAPGYRIAENPAAVHWDGTTWTAATVPDTGYLYGVADLSPSNAWAIGAGVKHWDGTTWSDVATPSPNPGGVGPGNLLGISARTTSDVWAVGTFAPTRHTTASFALHFDGTAWQLVSTPAGITLDSVVAVGPGDAWAVGSFNATSQPVTEHWNGTAWTVVPTPTVAPNGGPLRSVTARASNDVWAVGTAFTGEANVVHPLTMHWDGTAWSIVTSPPATSAQALGVSGRPGTTHTWAVGTQDPGVALILERH